MYFLKFIFRTPHEKFEILLIEIQVNSRYPCTLDWKDPKYRIRIKDNADPKTPKKKRVTAQYF